MLLYWLIPAIVVLGIVTSYTDLRYGKIKNNVLLIGLLYVFFLYHFFFLFQNMYDLTMNHLYALVVNGGIALGIGVLLWYMRFWTAGDAKLFFTFSILIPPIVILGKPELTVIDLMINTFVPLTLYLLVSAIEKISMKEFITVVKNVFHLRSIVTSVLLVFVVLWPVSLLEFYVSKQLVIFLLVLTLIYFSKSIQQLEANKVLLVLSGLACIRFLFDSSIIFFSAWMQFLFVLFAFVVLLLFFNGVATRAFTKNVSLSDLKPGMSLSEIIVKKGKKHVLQKLGHGDLGMHKGALFEPTVAGLTPAQIKLIKKAKNKNFKKLSVSDTISFAPFLFVGSLLQIILNNNVISVIMVALSFF